MPGVRLFDLNLIAIHPWVEKKYRGSGHILFPGRNGGNESQRNLKADDVKTVREKASAGRWRRASLRDRSERYVDARRLTILHPAFRQPKHA
ncbi:hypothetical protein [Burkholderia stagnalis]|uniref:hypothetical protein n=1 Tax=Burkholderia stagnalis TaxID=1503054 RepID=UPI0018C68F03|nr:hypothetical protein [Burkholderia stagnalis]